MNLIKNYGYKNINEDNINNIARVISVHKDRFEIVCNKGFGFAVLKKSEFYNKLTSFPCTGDFVNIVWNDCGDSVITAVLPRKTILQRKDPNPDLAEQAIAANFDYVFILCSLNHDFSINRIERFLSLAWESGGMPVVMLTKLDIAENDDYKIKQVRAIAGVAPVFAVSSVSGEGMTEISNMLKSGDTVVLVGSSGVGKSTFVNALAGETVMETGDIREDDSRGRHTTTYRHLILLKSGIVFIDTPGVRTVGMWHNSDGLAAAYPEIDALIGHCKFSDCSHNSEPGCVIKAALEDGTITLERWNSYQKLYEEMSASNSNASRAEILRKKAVRIRQAQNEFKNRKKIIY